MKKVEIKVTFNITEKDLKSDEVLILKNEIESGRFQRDVSGDNDFVKDLKATFKVIK